MLRTTDDQLLHWLTAGGTMVLITVIRSLTGYFRERQRLRTDYLRERQRLRTMKFVAVLQARSQRIDVWYTDGQSEIRAGPRLPGNTGLPGSVLPMRPDGQPERRRGERRTSDAS